MENKRRVIRGLETARHVEIDEVPRGDLPTAREIVSRCGFTPS